jgi:hypothetical protein
LDLGANGSPGGAVGIAINFRHLMFIAWGA